MPPNSVASPRPPAPSAVPKTYEDLLRCVLHVITTSRREAEARWVLSYHQIGRYINVHLLHNRRRAEHGARVYANLAADANLSKRTLQECAQFHRCFPNARALAQLGWNQCRLLCQISDSTERERVATEALRAGWGSRDLETRVRALNASAVRAAENEDAGGAATAVATPVGGRAPRLLTSKRGVPGRYRLAKAPRSPTAGEEALAADMGFKLYLPLSGSQARHRTVGEIVAIDDDGGLRSVEDAKPSDLFTYRAEVRRIIDGDTLEIAVALPHYRMHEKLRLRGIDCPEMNTPEGRAAKRVVEALLLEAEDVIVTTSKVDKYDRYLADVHFRLRSGDELFLNNHLLAHGHARPANSSMQDWLP